MAKNGTVGLLYSRRSYVFGREHMSSVERQDDDILASCTRDGLTPEAFTDAQGHRSGFSVKSRPGYRRMVQRIPDPDVKCVYFDLLDRAWRNVEEWNKLLRTCQDHDVSIKLVAFNIEIGGDVDPFRKNWLDIMASSAELESRLASHRQKKEAKHKKEQGVFVGTVPFGAKRHGRGLEAVCKKHIGIYGYNTEAGHWYALRGAIQLPDGTISHEGQIVDNVRVIDHSQAVVQVIDHFKRGMSDEAVAGAMNVAGHWFVSRQGILKPFGPEAVRSIIGNIPFYTGHIVPGRFSAKQPPILQQGDGTVLQQYLTALGAIRSDKIERIITDEQACALLQSRLNRRHNGRSLLAPRALLTPIAHLDDGRLLRAGVAHGKLRYRTRRAPIVTIDAGPIDAALTEHISALVFPEPMRRRLVEMATQVDASEERERYRQLANECRARLDRIREMREDGMISRDEAREKSQRINLDLASAMERAMQPDEFASYVEEMTGFGDVFGRADIIGRKRIIQRMFSSITVNAAGEIVAIKARPWARDAFGLLIEATRAECQRRPRQDLNPQHTP